MDHIAILRKAIISKNDNLLEDILAGTKTIESRWYVNKISPWNKIRKNDLVYFKESGRQVIAVAEVLKVLQFENLNKDITNQIIENYGKQIAPHSTESEFESWAKRESKKRYCILIFLENVKKIKPFNIDKKGYGISSAWLAVENIGKVKRPD